MPFRPQRQPVFAPPADTTATVTKTGFRPMQFQLEQVTKTAPSPSVSTGTRLGPATSFTYAPPPPASIVNEDGSAVDPAAAADPVYDPDPVEDPEDDSTSWDEWAAVAEKSWDAAPTMAKAGAIGATAIGIVGTGVSFYVAARVGRTSKGWLAPVGAGFLGLLGTAVLSGTVAAATGARQLIPCGGSTNLAGLGALQAGVRLPRQALGAGRSRPCVGCGR
jgi:hypothetical protein